MNILMPIPSTDFDPTETAVPWQAMARAKVNVIFATPDGEVAAADGRMLTGRGLGPWRPFLRAAKVARLAYAEMVASEAFLHPIAYADIAATDLDAIVLPGGHAPGMKPYLESPLVQVCVAKLWAARKPVAAICHGVLVLARTLDAEGQSVVAGRRLTALTRSMEMSAWRMTGLWLKSYYRTYPTSVQDEVSAALGEGGAFEEGPFAARRDTPENTARGFIVEDGNLLTARWPGDAYRFSERLVELLLAS